MFYYYHDQLCKAISSSPRVTCKVTNKYGKIIKFIADRHHIYLQPRAQQGSDRHIGCYRMMHEDIEQFIKDQQEIWVKKQEKEKEGKGKRKEKEKEGKGKEKEDETTPEEEKEETNKSKATVGEK